MNNDRRKFCVQCGTEFHRRSDITHQRWEEQQYCGHACAGRANADKVVGPRFAKNVIPVKDPAWRRRAACTYEDPDLFFSPDKRLAGQTVAERITKAKAVCERCPVREDCLAEALRFDDDSIAGGLTRKERNKLLRLLPIYKEAS